MKQLCALQENNIPTSLGEPVSELPHFSPFKMSSPLWREQNTINLKLCPVKPQRDLVLGAPAPQILGLRGQLGKLGSISSAPCSQRCFCSGIWDHRVKGSGAGPISDRSERGKPDAERRTWRRSLGRGRRSTCFWQSQHCCSEVSGLSPHEDKAGWLVSQDISCSRT